MAFPTGWAHKVAITIDHDDIDADLTDWTLVFDQEFDSVLTQVNGPLDADGTRASINGGGDVRFSSDSAGNTQLACDIRNWVTNNTPGSAECEAAVKVPSVSSSVDTTIYMWWGKSGENQPSVSDTYGQYNAYDSAYEAVWPMSENPAGTAPQILDRTSNQNHGTSAGSMTSDDLVTGQIGKAIDFDRTNDVIIVDYDASLYSTAYTVSMLVDSDISDYSSGSGYLVSKYDWQGDKRTWALLVHSGPNRFRVVTSDDGVNITNADTTQAPETGWQYIAISTSDAGDTWTFRYNLSTPQTLTDCDGYTNQSSDLYIGGLDGTTNRGVDGRMDEVRISSENRSAAWCKAEYNNLLNTSGFLTWGTIQDVGGAQTASITDTVGITDTVTRTGTFIRSIADSVGLTDVLAAAASIFVALADAVGITDVVTRTGTFVRTVADAVGVTDAVVASLVFLRSITDTVGITDTVQRTVFKLASIADAVGVTDTLTRIFTGVRVVQDQVGVTDALVSRRNLLRAISDAVGVTDVVSASALLFVTIADTVGVTDVLTASAAALKTALIEDTVGVTDVVIAFSGGRWKETKIVGSRITTSKQVDSTKIVGSRITTSKQVDSTVGDDDGDG